MRRVLSITNRKGGSGKTTTTVNVAAALAMKGRKVLVVDADSQGHSTISFGLRTGGPDPTLFELLTGKADIQEALRDTYIPTLKVIPASRNLTGFARSFARDKDARVVLREGISGLNGSFEYVVIDTPPVMGLLTVSALIASNEVYIPMQTHFLSLEGLAEIVMMVRKIRDVYGTDLELMGVIPTFFKERTRLSKGIVENIRKNLGEHIILHPVRENVALAEAPSFGETIFQYRVRSNGAHDYMALAAQIDGMSEE